MYKLLFVVLIILLSEACHMKTNNKFNSWIKNQKREIAEELQYLSVDLSATGKNWYLLAVVIYLHITESR